MMSLEMTDVLPEVSVTLAFVLLGVKRFFGFCLDMIVRICFSYIFAEVQ